MIISKDTVVGIEYTLTDSKNEILDSSEGMGPLEYLHGHNNLIPGLERELEGKKAGDNFKVSVAPADGYGERMDDLVVEVARAQFPDDVEITVGMQFEAGGPDGSRVVTVSAITGDKVTVDANHALAGEVLNFDVKVISVRESTDDEKANGLESDCDDGCGCDDDDEDDECSGSCCTDCSGCGH